MAKKKRNFISTFSVLFIILIVACVATFLIPAGRYSTLSYNSDLGCFVVKAGEDDLQYKPATQETLDSLDIDIPLSDFTDGDFTKEVSIPNTYQSVEQSGQGILEFLQAPINGMMQTADIVFFLLMIGGAIGVVNYMNLFNIGIRALAKACKNKEKLLIIIVTGLVAFGGTTFGMCEETLPFYPVLLPVFVIAGYDLMTGFATIFVGSCVGQMFSTVSPFSVVIASDIAGTDFSQGLVVRIIGLVIAFIIAVVYINIYASKVKKRSTENLKKTAIDEEKKSKEEEEVIKLSFRHKLVLILFACTFIFMVVGIVCFEWSFLSMATLFMVSGVVLGVVGGLKEKEIVKSFLSGAADMIGVALVIGVARSIKLILTQGYVIDTILNTLSNFVLGMSPIVFILVLMFIFMILGCIINSSSGLAVLSMPILAPLADVVGIPRDVVVSAYIYGLGIANFVTPTGTIFVALEVAGLNYKKWIKFALPLIGMLCLLGMIMLVVQIYF